MPTKSQSLPMAGIRVLDLTAVYSGPMASALFAEQGADVIKVETSGGDTSRRVGPMKGDISSVFVAMNRGKRGIVLDLKSEDGRQVLTDLIKRCDVLMENFRPGVMSKLGFSRKRLQELNTKMVYLSITGFGQDGPYTSARVYDAVIQAVSGMCAAHPERPSMEPGLVATTLCDKLTALTAAQAVTSALLARERDGKGRVVELSMLDAALAFNWPDAMYNHAWMDDPPPLLPEAGITLRPYKTKNGYLATMMPQQDEFNGMCKGLGIPEICEDPRFSTLKARATRPKEIREMFEPLVAQHDTDQLLARLRENDVPVGKVNTRDQVLTDPQVVHNGSLIQIDQGKLGRVRVARAAAIFDEKKLPVPKAAPHLGEHTQEVLRELGYSDERISALLSSQK